MTDCARGMFAPKNRGKLLIEKTEEGIDISMPSEKGYVADDEIERFPGVTHKVGVHPVMECTQNIPCNLCQDAALRSIASGLEKILPPSGGRSGCGIVSMRMCVASCPDRQSS